MTWTRAVAVVALGLTIPGCGGTSPTTPASVHETFTGDLTSLDTGQVNALHFHFSAQGGGSAVVSVSWTALSAGTGTYGAAAPSFSVFLGDGAINLASGGPSPTQPVGLSAQVHPGSYTLDIVNLQLCGGCVTRVTADVTHP